MVVAQGARSIVLGVSLVRFATRGCNKKEKRGGGQEGECTKCGETRVQGQILNHGAPLRQNPSPPRSSLLVGGGKKRTTLARKAGAKGRETMRLIDDDRSSCSEFGKQLDVQKERKEGAGRATRGTLKLSPKKRRR